MGQRRYRVYLTPLSDVDSNTYGTEIDVSDRVEISGISNITKSIDSADYDFGVFFFSDLTLKGYNYNGYFNEESDIRSIFRVTRDRCKVRIEFENIDIDRNSSNRITSTSAVNTTTFYGIINEEATRLDVVTDTIQFKVLSRDSVLRTTNIPAGTVSDGMTFKSAMTAILNNPQITSLLNVSASNINPDLNIQIDVGAEFDNITVKEGLDQLLLVSNSVLLIDQSMNVIIKNRTEDITRPIITLYGKSDQYARENIVTVTTYNSGKHRMFTAVKFNGYEASNAAYVATFGYRQKSIDFAFITDSVKNRQIAESLLDQFKTPKIEVSVQVPTSIAKSLRLLDRVSLNFPLRAKPPAGKFLPVYGSSVYGDASTPYPNVYGSIKISRYTAFKIIEIEDNPKEYLSIVRLRQVGKDIGDGVFNLPDTSIYGFGLYGDAKYKLKNNDIRFNPSVYGAGEYGETHYGEFR